MKFTAKVISGQVVVHRPETLALFASKHPQIRYVLTPLMAESRNQRAFIHGAILPLWCYLDHNDYKDAAVLEHYYEIAKVEFNPQIFTTRFKAYKIGGSTKGKLNEGFIEKIIDFLEEQYGIDRSKVLSPDLYKEYRDVLRPFENVPDNFIDYMKWAKVLK